MAHGDNASVREFFAGQLIPVVFAGEMQHQAQFLCRRQQPFELRADLFVRRLEHALPQVGRQAKLRHALLCRKRQQFERFLEVIRSVVHIGQQVAVQVDHSPFFLVEASAYAMPATVMHAVAISQR